jgi:outer membrane porin, OprD family
MKRSTSRCVLRHLLAAAGAWGTVSALAQGISPGPLSAEGYKLGGFEPTVQLRTYYFDNETISGGRNEAWAVGGWAGVRSPWWGDIFQIGVLGYTSQKLYGPDDKDGTRLLMPGQKSFSVLGEAWGALKIFDQTLTGYRQLVNRPYINPQDSRMVPNTFEAYTLTGAASGVSYTGGFIAKMKTRNSDSFDWMSTVAGSKGTHKGVGYGGLTWDFMKNGYVRVDEQYADDLFNTFYVDGRFPIAIDDQTLVVLGAQFTHQKSIGQEFIGSFSTKHAGVQAAINRGPFGAQVYYTQNGKGFDSQNPFGDHASYLNLMHVAFNTAGEKTWGIGGNVNFASLGAPGLTASAIYAASNGRIDATTSAAIPDRKETDLRADYAFAKDSALSGLVATLRGGWLHQDGSPTAYQLRVILNYAVPL